MLWNALVWLGGLIVLPVTKLRGHSGVGRALRWLLHLVLLAAILVGLWYLSYILDLDRLLRAPWPVLRTIWLPLICFLIYLLAWLGWLLWRLLREEHERSEFPAIDRAWDEAVLALERAGISLSETPLFLVVGRPQGAEVNLFHAAQLPLVVTQVPRQTESPLHVFANNEGIYVTCTDTSFLSRYAMRLARRQEAAKAPPPAPVEPQPATEATRISSLLGGSMTKPSEPAGNEAWNQASGAAAAPASANPGRTETETSASPASVRDALEFDADEVDDIAVQLKHVCFLIARDRRPYCPINGVLALTPFAAIEGDHETTEAAMLLDRDLEMIREATQVCCPLLVVVCNLEQATGCRDLLQRFPEEQRKRRLGVEFPLLVGRDATGVPQMVEEGLRWVCQSLIPALVYRLVHIKKSGESGEDEENRLNVQVYRFLAELRQREKRLVRLLTRGINLGADEPWLLGGCFLVATGADPTREQGFLGGLFPQLQQMQNTISWTRFALKEDVGCRLWTNLGYIALAVCTVAVLSLAIWL